MRLHFANRIWLLLSSMSTTPLIPRIGDVNADVSGRYTRIRKAVTGLRFVSLLVNPGLCVLSLSIFVLASAGTARAQSLYGSIRGVITDPTGGVIPDVAVTATNMATNVSQQAKSRQDGTYSFLQLAVGDYSLRAEKDGFKGFAATKIHLDLNSVYIQDIHLVLGATTEMIEVEASAVQVDTSSAQSGVVIDSNQLVNMPLLGRSFIQLQELQPGVVGGSDRFGYGTSTPDLATNGGQTQFNVFLIDGTDTNDLVLNTFTFIPPPDAMTEFRMVSGTLNPEYARSSGAILSALIKSGTNAFHGDAYDFYRDTFMMPIDPFTQKRPKFHQNEFGATIGGPIIKNHTFFFFSYGGERFSEPQPGSQTVSTVVYSAAQLGGTFGPTVASSNPSPFPLWGDTCPPSGPKCAAGTPYSTLFASGNIPTQDFSTFSTGLVTKYVPSSNQADGQTFVWNPNRQASDNQYLVRIDENISSKDSIWGTLFIESFPRTDSSPFFGATLPGFSETDKVHSKFLSLSWTHYLSDHILNELRGGYNRFNFDAVEPTTPVSPSSAGFNITPQDTAGQAFPVIDVQGLFKLGFSEDGPQPRIDQVYQGADNLTLIHGSHTLKMGFDMRRWEVFNPFLSNNDGLIVFRPYGTYSTGNAGADFLLGIPTRYIQSSGAVENSRAQQYYSYIQDQYRVRSDLTINYGVGWTIDTPMNNIAYNGHGQVAFRPGQQSIVFPNAPVGVVYQGDPGVHSAGATYPWRQWGPRVGFAYSPSWGGWLTGGPGKTSIRGGYGIFYDRSETEQADQVVGMPPFAITESLGVFSSGGATLQVNPSFQNPFTDIATGAAVANPFPYGGPSQSVAFTSANGNLPVFSFCCAVLDGATRDPVAENFSLTLERQVTANTIVSLGYVGSVAHHLTVGLPVGVATGLNASNNPTFNYDPTVYGPIDTLLSIGNSRYSSLQATVNKRLSHNLQFLVSYTYAHSIDSTSGFENSAFASFGGQSGGFSTLRTSNPYCFPKCAIASSIYDARQRLVISYFYEIPGLHRGELLSRATSGWTIGGITQFQTGFPLDVIDSAAPSGGCNGGGDFGCWDGPNLVGPIHYLDPRKNGNVV